jgi:hypothetical protein
MTKVDWFRQYYGIFLVVLSQKCIGSDDWPARIDGNTKRRGFFLGCEGLFQRNSVHDSRIRIFCEFCARARVCVYSAKGKVPECVQNNEDLYAQIKKVIIRQMQKITFYFIAEIP